MSHDKVGAIVVAAGSGVRLGNALPKAFVPVAGRSLLQLSLDSVLAVCSPPDVVVVVPDHPAAVAADLPSGVVTVLGGAERADSVARGLQALPPDVDIVLVHDAARPFVPLAVFDQVIATVRGGAAGAVPGLAVTDTIKRVAGDRIVETVPRADLVAVQTPQGFRRATLDQAYRQFAVGATDDAALLEALGHPVQVVPGSADSFKITTAADLRVAEALFGPTIRRAEATRTAEAATAERSAEKTATGRPA